MPPLRHIGLLLLVLASAGQVRPAPPTPLVTARELYNQGRFDDAIEAATRALTQPADRDGKCGGKRPGLERRTNRQGKASPPHRPPGSSGILYQPERGRTSGSRADRTDGNHWEVYVVLDNDGQTHTSSQSSCCTGIQNVMLAVERGDLVAAQDAFQAAGGMSACSSLGEST